MTVQPFKTQGNAGVQFSNLMFTGPDEYINTNISNGFVMSTGNFDFGDPLWIDTDQLDPSVGILVNGNKRLYHNGSNSMRWFNLGNGDQTLRFYSGNLVVYDESDVSQELVQIYVNNNTGNIMIPQGDLTITTFDKTNEDNPEGNSFVFSNTGNLILPYESTIIIGEGGVEALEGLSFRANHDITIDVPSYKSVIVRGGNLDVGGTSSGYITVIGPIPNSDDDVFISAAAGDTDGFVYGVGGDFLSGPPQATIVKLDLYGNAIWQTAINVVDIFPIALSESIIMVGGIPTVVSNDYTGEISNVIIQQINPIDGSSLSTIYVSSNTTIESADIASNGSGNVIIVGLKENDYAVFSNVIAIGGSNVSILGVSTDIFDSNVFPAADNTWYVNGYNIEGDSQVIGIDTFMISTPIPNVCVTGGSISFDGGNHFIHGTDPELVGPIGTNDFTIEFWLKMTGLLSNNNSGGDGVPYKGYVYSSGFLTGSSSVYVRSVDGTDNTPSIIGIEVEGTDDNVEATGLTSKLTDNAWHYVVIQRSSGVLTIYVDAGLATISTLTDDLNLGSSIVIGEFLQSDVTNFRITRDAVYGGTPATPTDPLTAITDTTILLNASSMGNVFIDSSISGFNAGTPLNSNSENIVYSSDSPYSGSGFSVIVTWSPIDGTYSGSITNAGTGYHVGDSFIVLGTDLQGISPDNDCNIIVTEVDGSAITAVSYNGTGPFGQNKTYLLIDQTIDFSQPLPPDEQWNIKHTTNQDGFIWTPNWQYYIGRTGYDQFYSVATAPDFSIYAVGQSYSEALSRNTTLIVKFDAIGEIQWKKSVDDDNSHNLAFGVCVASDNNIFVSSTNNNDNLICTKISPDGSIIWQTRIGGDDPMGIEEGVAIAIDSDNNPVTAAQFNSIDSQDDDILIIKFNGSDGTVIWQRSLGTAGNDEQFYDSSPKGISIIDNYYIVNGYTYGLSPEDANGFIAKLPLDGSGIGFWGSWTYSVQDWNVESLETSSVDIIDIIVQPGDMIASSVDFGSRDNTQLITVQPFGSSGGNITNISNTVFLDGTIQSTAASGDLKTWISPNNTRWFIESYDDGIGITGEGDTPILWFDAANATQRGTFSGAIIDYHAVLPEDGSTIVGQIIISSSLGNNNITHTETTSGNENIALCSWWNRTGTEGQIFFTGRNGWSEPMYVQWTSKVFFGREFFC